MQPARECCSLQPSERLWLFFVVPLARVRRFGAKTLLTPKGFIVVERLAKPPAPRSPVRLDGVSLRFKFVMRTVSRRSNDSAPYFSRIARSSDRALAALAAAFASSSAPDEQICIDSAGVLPAACDAILAAKRDSIFTRACFSTVFLSISAGSPAVFELTFAWTHTHEHQAHDGHVLGPPANHLACCSKRQQLAVAARRFDLAVARRRLVALQYRQFGPLQTTIELWSWTGAALRAPHWTPQTSQHLCATHHLLLLSAAHDATDDANHHSTRQCLPLNPIGRLLARRRNSQTHIRRRHTNTQ